MPLSTNPKAPVPTYASARTDRGAAFRASLSVAAAKAKLPTEAAQATLQKLLDSAKARKTQRDNGKAKPFNTNPWSSYSAAQAGTEYVVEQRKWRLIQKGADYFLANHVGSNNDFEYWHIDRSIGLELPAAADNAEAIATPPGTPVVHNAVETPAIGGAGNAVLIRGPAAARAIPPA